MVERKHKEIINKYENRINELKKRQALIEKNELESGKLENIIKNFQDNKDDLYKFYENKSNDKPSDQEISTITTKFENILFEIDEWILNIDQKIDHFFEEVYDKIPGDLFGIIGIFIFIFSTVTAVILYLVINPNYSIFHNFISDLGIGPGGSHIVFNTGWILSSGIILFFHVYEIQKLKKKVKQKRILKLMALSNVVLTMGIFLVGFFPESDQYYHVVAAIFYFSGGLSFFSLFGLLAFLNKQVTRIYTFLAGIMCVCYLLYFSSPLFPAFFSDLGLDVNSTEWLTLFSEVSMMLAILIHSLIEDYYMKKYEKEKVNIKKGELYESKFQKSLLEYIEHSKNS